MFKWFRKDSDVKTIERYLELITSKITKHEATLSRLRANGRRYKGAITLYGILFYAIYFIIWALFLAKNSTNKRKWALETLPLIVAPFVLYVLRNGISSYYARRVSNEELSLQDLQAQQKEKIEEFKTKTGFYTTKSLIDRYSASEGSPRDATTNSTSSSPLATKKLNPKASKNDLTSPRLPQMRSSPRLLTQAQITPQRNFPPQSLLGTVPTPSSLSGTPQKNSQPQLSPTAEFAPNADLLAATQARTRHWYDRMLDVIVGEDEGSDQSRYKLEQKVRERDERIAGLELELLKLRKVANQSPEEEHHSAPEITMEDSKIESSGVAVRSAQPKIRKSKRRTEMQGNVDDDESD